MSSRFRILVLADSRSFHTGRYVGELRRQGCKVLTVSLEKGVGHQFTLKRRGLIRPFDYAAASLEIRALVKRFRPDVINPHFSSGYGFSVALAGVRKLAPVVLHLWGSDILIVPHKSFLHRWKTSLALSRADCVLGDSDYILQQAENLAPIRQRRTVFWGIERDSLTFQKSDFQVSRPLEIIVPRPHETVYNNLFLLEALAPLINEGTISITFPEFGGLLEQFRSEAQNRCGDKVKLYPKMPRRAFTAFLARHDVYLSGAVSDSSPVSLLEAMGLGLIPVVADVPGVRQWLTSESGFAFALEDADDLRKTMTRLVDAGDSLEQMRKNNIDRVRKEAIFEDNIAETIDVMRQLAGKGRT